MVKLVKLQKNFPQTTSIPGDWECILLGLFWLFLFQFRNNRMHGISTLKRTLLMKTEYPWRRWSENYYVCTRAGGRVGFPAKNFPKEGVFWLFRVNRIPFVLFILLSGAEFIPKTESLLKEHKYRLFWVFLFRNSPERTRPELNTFEQRMETATLCDCTRKSQNIIWFWVDTLTRLKLGSLLSF